MHVLLMRGRVLVLGCFISGSDHSMVVATLASFDNDSRRNWDPKLSHVFGDWWSEKEVRGESSGQRNGRCKRSIGLRN